MNLMLVQLRLWIDVSGGLDKQRCCHLASIYWLQGCSWEVKYRNWGRRELDALPLSSLDFWNQKLAWLISNKFCSQQASNSELSQIWSYVHSRQCVLRSWSKGLVDSWITLVSIQLVSLSAASTREFALKANFCSYACSNLSLMAWNWSSNL